MDETKVKIEKVLPNFNGYESFPVITAFVTFNSYNEKVKFLQKVAPETKPYV